MIYDVHVHIGRWLPSFAGSNDALAAQVERARLHGITRQCINSLGNTGYLPDPTLAEVRAANDHVLEAMETYPDTLLGFCYVNPRHGQAALAEIERCVVDGGMVGIKLWIACKGSDSLVDPILTRAGQLGVPVLQHAWNKTVGQLEFESTTADVAEMGRRHPEVNLIMAHLMGAGARGILDIAPYPNISVDTSGGDPEAGLLEYAVRTLGAERILFGSDAPGRSYGVQLGKVLGGSAYPRPARADSYRQH
ncbi:MAG TPA: amidohydrolase family protein [Armatimonadota bacterium]|nr:amidohydrolase family protein [Armatimonadota bacterium]